MTPLNIAEWQSLDRHYSDIKYLSMREQFVLDSGRFERFSIRSGDLLLDYSKNRITQETIEKLIALAEAVKVVPKSGKLGDMDVPLNVSH